MNIFRNKMNKDETVKMNISLAFDFFREIIKNPALGEQIPNGATVVFLDKDQVITQKQTAEKTNNTIT